MEVRTTFRVTAWQAACRDAGCSVKCGPLRNSKENALHWLREHRRTSHNDDAVLLLARLHRGGWGLRLGDTLLAVRQTRKSALRLSRKLAFPHPIESDERRETP